MEREVSVAYQKFNAMQDAGMDISVRVVMVGANMLPYPMMYTRP
jgi:hypothetical protein